MVDGGQSVRKEAPFTSHYHIRYRPMRAYGDWRDLAVRDTRVPPPPRIGDNQLPIESIVQLGDGLCVVFMIMNRLVVHAL